MKSGNNITLYLNKNKIESSAANRKKIVLYGQCKNPKIHNKFLRYFDDVTREIRCYHIQEVHLKIYTGFY